MDTKALFDDMVAIGRAHAKLITHPIYSLAPDDDGGYVIQQHLAGEYTTIATINNDAIKLAISLVAKANKEE